MSPPLGYRPDRIDSLFRSTQHARRALTDLRDDDPAAAAALGAVRRTERTLDAEWLPLLVSIRSSEAMVSWRNAMLEFITGVRSDMASWFTATAASTNPHASLSDEELILQMLDAQAGRHRPGADEAFVAPDVDLAAEVARRVGTDEDFRVRMLDTAEGVSVIGSMFEIADFDEDFIVAFTTALVLSPSTSSLAMPGRPHHSDTGAAMQWIAEHAPDRALDMLQDRSITDQFVLAGTDDRLPTDAIQVFISAALLVAPTLDGTRLEDSYRALAVLIDLGRQGDIDVGVLRGTTTALAIHLPGLADKVRDGTADITPWGSDVSLGSYDTVTAFYGQAMHDPRSQAIAGGLISAHIDAQMRSEWPPNLERHGAGTTETAAGILGHLAFPSSNVVDMLFVDGIATEQQRQNMLAGAEQATRDGWIDLFLGVPSNVFPLIGASKAVMTTFGGVESATGWIPDVHADRVVDSEIRFALPDQIRATALELVMETPEGRDFAGLGELSPAGLAVVTTVSTELRGTTDASERLEVMRDLEVLEGTDKSDVTRFLDEVVANSKADTNADKVVRD